MKTLLKILGIIVLTLIIMVIGVALFINFRGIPSYKIEMPAGLADLNVEITPERVARGARIASLTCVQCHRGADNKLSGNVLRDAPKQFGWIHSANITQHPTRGIGRYTDGQLMFLLRTSIKRDGKYAPPYMPGRSRVADEDLYSIIAWLRSDDPLVQPSDSIAPKPKPSFLTKMLCTFVFKPVPYPEKPVLVPDSTDVVAFGKYQANSLYDCFGCHSADFKTNNEQDPEKSVGFYGGGNPLLNLDGEIVRANITMDKTGIAHYTKEDFIRTVKWGMKPDGTPVRYPMIPHTTMTDGEVGAIFEYLKTVPHQDHAFPRPR